MVREQLKPRRSPPAAILLCALIATLAAPAAARAAVPTVLSISPNNGREGSAITITGSGFGDHSEVLFGGTRSPLVSVNSSGSLSASAPPGGGTVDLRVGGAGGLSATTPADRFAYDAAPSSPWLGLDGNNSNSLGPPSEFTSRGVVYDRSGPVDWTAGELAREGGGPTAGGRVLGTDLANGMVPVVTIEYRGYSGAYQPDTAFPSEAHGQDTLAEYVSGFVASASSILAAYPDRGIVFEPINEPWGYTTPQFDGGEYADVVAKLLPAARSAGIPLTSVYVGATGDHWVTQMYAARPRLQSEVAGWYLHPYGPPSGASPEDVGGIQSLPAVQAEMTSGQNNLIVSEVGYCAADVNEGRSCGHDTFAHGVEAADALHEMLVNTQPYHEAGWLRALLVYSRNDGGWAMQLPGGALTEQGRTLLAFAEAQEPSSPASGSPPLVAIAGARCLAPLADAVVSSVRLFISDGFSCAGAAAAAARG